MITMTNKEKERFLEVWLHLAGCYGTDELILSDLDESLKYWLTKEGVYGEE